MLELKEKADLCSFTSEALGSHSQAVKTRAPAFPTPSLASQESSHLTPITSFTPDGFQIHISKYLRKYLRCVFPFWEEFSLLLKEMAISEWVRDEISREVRRVGDLLPHLAS